MSALSVKERPGDTDVSCILLVILKASIISVNAWNCQCGNHTIVDSRKGVPDRRTGHNKSPSTNKSSRLTDCIKFDSWVRCNAVYRYRSRSANEDALRDDDDPGRPVGVVQPTRVASAPERSLGDVGKTKVQTQRSGIHPTHCCLVLYLQCFDA